MRRLLARIRLARQNGDTIVEVMVVLAVLGLSFSISYATANRGLNQSRNAEEHSQALGLLDSQVELLRQAFTQQTNTSKLTDGTDFCMSDPSNPSVSTPFSSTPGDTVNNVAQQASADNFSKYPNACFQPPFYYESIHYNTTNPSNPFFDFRVRWDGIGNLGRQQEEINYVIYAASTPAHYQNNPPRLPTVTLHAFPTSVTAGSGSNLSWSSTDASFCTASGSWNGIRLPSGTFSTGPLSSTSTYNLTCTGAGGSASATATVTVTRPKPQILLYASPSTVTQGSSSYLYWRVRNATACAASGSWNGFKSAGRGNYYTGPLNSTSTYNLTCTGAGGTARASTTVTVTCPYYDQGVPPNCQPLSL